MTWFERLVGFREDGYESTQRRLSVEGSELVSLVNGKRYGIGELSLPTLAELRARVNPARGQRSSARILVADVRRLHRAIRDRLRMGISVGGASFDRYRDAHGGRGGMQDLFLVHRRRGEPCPRCRTTIEKGVVAQRGTYWCPRCQPEREGDPC